jgi:protein involved in polysaccharide export with SLBB domain
MSFNEGSEALATNVSRGRRRQGQMVPPSGGLFCVLKHVTKKPTVLARVILCVALLLGISCAASAQKAGYTLQSGNAIEISVLQDPSLNRKLVTAPDGVISFPLAGQVRTGGRTVKALESQLAKRLGKNYLAPPQVTVTLAETGAGAIGGGTASPRIYVTGEVNNPGTILYQPRYKRHAGHSDVWWA